MSDSKDNNEHIRVMRHIVSDDDDDNEQIRVIRHIMSNDEDDDDHIRVIRDIMSMSNDEDDDNHIRVVRHIMSSDDDDDHIGVVTSIRNRILDKKNDDRNIRIIAAIDFGTTFSGLAYAYKSNPSRIFVYKDWQEYSSCINYKTPTVLTYDKSFNVVSWGYSALAGPPEDKNKKKRKKDKNKEQQNFDVKFAEKFKLCLSKEEGKCKPYLPEGLSHKTAITHYLKKMGDVLKEILKKPCQDIDFFNQVLIIMTVPAEFDYIAINTMRECAYKAGLIKFKKSSNLKFTTEPEAAAIHCMDNLEVLDVGVDESFMVVDCGGGTVDLTTRKLLEGNKLSEKTKRKGGYCGGSFVDERFIEFLGRKVGTLAINTLRGKHDGRLQYIVQEFCRRIKFPFTGEKRDFKPFDLDLEELCPDIMQYVEGSERDKMVEDEWTIEIKFEDVKDMFDPVIKEILDLIRDHLDENDKDDNDVSAMLLVGGFSESKYLQERVKQEFNDRLNNKISFPENPITAIVEGAVQYGLRQEVIATRVLKWTYGTDVARRCVPNDPEERKLPGGQIIEFSRLIECEKEIPVDTVISRIFSPGCLLQRRMGLDLYITEEHDADFCDSPGVKPLGEWAINIPITFGPRPILYLLIFGDIELSAVAVNLVTGVVHETIYKSGGDF
ncbi:hypothetical protein C1645_805944 [Glomus cerebriforme]|uniref:Actin-like ATPase domain-containing protein n=1 Tax=Glomus cerebriforme TaxID=658196 RepID=A0A397T1S0_9GLOM|nr:hypothetical protein C1645_805944 [Glomus cerebriforme]